MKKIKILLCALLSLCTIFLLAACGGGDDSSSKKSSSAVKSSAEITSENESENSEDANSADDTSSAKSNSSSLNSQSKSSSKAAASNAASSKTSTNTGAGRSWDEILAGMPKALRGTTLEVYSWNAAKDVTGATKVISNFEKATGIKVKFTKGSYDNYNAEMTARIAAKNSPDLIRMYLPWEEAPGQIQFLQPLSVTGFDFTDAAWDKELMSAYTRKGKAYATNLENTLINQPAVMMYNKELIAKYDLEDPYTLWKANKWTFSKFQQICKDYKAETNKVAWTTLNAQDYMALLGLQGPISFDGTKYAATLKDEKTIAGYKKTIEMVEDGIIDKKGWNMPGFENGDLLFFSISIIGARKTHFYFSDMKSKNILGVAPMPSIDGQSTYYQPFRELEALGVCKGAKNASAAPYFMRYYLDADNYDEKSFFNDAKTLEVYKFCMKQKIVTSNHHDSFFSDLIAVPSAQTATVLSTHFDTIKKRADELNEILKKY